MPQLKSPKALTVGQLIKALRKVSTNIPVMMTDIENDGDTRVIEVIVMRDHKNTPLTLNLVCDFSWSMGDEEEEEDDEEGQPYGDVPFCPTVSDAIREAIEEQRMENEGGAVFNTNEVDCVQYDKYPMLTPA